MLKHLRMPTMSKLWEELSQHRWSNTEYLSALCEYELQERDTRRTKRHMAEAQLPPGKSLSTFIYSESEGAKGPEIQALASGEQWIKQGDNLLIFGPPGTGKTHLAVGIGRELIARGNRVRFYRTSELLQKLQAAKQSLNLSGLLSKLEKYDCMILDDFGYVQKDKDETEVLFELICERYERRSLLITCNYSFNEWDKIFKEQTMAVAAVDRLVHHARIIELMGKSYRQKEALNRHKLPEKTASSKAQSEVAGSDGADANQGEVKAKEEVKINALNRQK